jgi:hypothetical protein
MFSLLFKKLTKLKFQLTRISENKPIHLISLFFIICLDIFVLFNIFQGLYFQKEEVVKPIEIIPYSCQDIIDYNTNRFNYANNIDFNYKYSLINYALYKNNYYSNNNYKYSSEFINNKKNDLIFNKCKILYDEAIKLADSSILQALESKINTAEELISDLRSENYNYEDNYNTMLLEDIASQKDDLSIIDGKSHNVKYKITENNKKIEDLKAKITNLENEIINKEISISFISLVNTYQQEILDKLENLNFWYPLEKLTKQLIFILPLTLLFFWIYRRNLQKENSVYTLIFSHLFLVSLIPIFIKILELLLDILPFHFLGNILIILETLGIIAIFNYLIILIAIILTLGIIYFLQKYIFSSEKIWIKRIEKKQCWNCGKNRVFLDELFCNFCGKENLIKCVKCGNFKINHAKYCNKCGE